MKYIRTYESFKQPQGTGSESSWEKEVDGDIIKFTLDDINDYLDSGQEMDPNELSHLLIDTERDPERIEAADLEYPVILTSSGGRITSILDGQHRVVKAIRDGVPVRVRILDLDLAPENFRKVLLG